VTRLERVTASLAVPCSPSQAPAAGEGDQAPRPQPRRLAWQDAELALAALQARLVGALGDKALAEERLVAAQAAATRAEVRAEGALAAAREEGSTRVAALEATVARLSGRSDLAGQVSGGWGLQWVARSRVQACCNLWRSLSMLDKSQSSSFASEYPAAVRCWLICIPANG
jgi:hypothetical protein